LKGIFKDTKFLNEKQRAKVQRFKKIVNRLNRWILRITVLFNAIMMFLMLERMSVLALFFIANAYYLMGIFTRRKFFID
jgi:hypothetical protein